MDAAKAVAAMATNEGDCLGLHPQRKRQRKGNAKSPSLCGKHNYDWY
nr:hypothetical protein [Thermoanaerobacter brockii]